jgi:3-oxoacyl-[acyl-carrier protein] reductase
MGAGMSTQRIAVITGASSGIGHATAQLFLKQGWTVIGLSRRSAGLPGVIDVLVDLSSADLQHSLINVLDDRLNDLCGIEAGCIALIHNAASFGHDSALAVNAGYLTHMLQINVVASTVINSIVARRMGEGSSIIYIGSTLSEKAVANTASYVISKHAVVGLMKATCQDLRGKKIHTACICPGFVDTPMLRAGQDDAALASYAASTSYEKILMPDEVAQIIFNAVITPALNGAVIHANYGQLEH